MRLALVLTLWAAASLSAQIITITPGPPAAPAQGGRGRGSIQPQPARPLRPGEACTLEGSTVNAITGEPAKSVTVTLQLRAPAAGMSRGGSSGVYTTTSDAAGKFAMKDLPPGEYRVLAQRTGFSTAVYGVSSGRGFGTLINLTPGQRMTGLELRLRPQAVIAGRVVDENGDPVLNAVVAAKYPMYTQGRRQLSNRGSASTNDLGEYRIFNLEPGRYYISVSQPSGSMIPPSSEDRSAKPQPEESYVTTYYPGTADSRSATQVDVAAGAVVQGINLRLAKSPAVRVRGRVINTSGATSTTTMAYLDSSDDSVGVGTNLRSASASQGQFEFRGVPPGRYTLSATAFVASDIQKRQQGRTVIEVGSSNLEDVTVTLAPGFDLSGSLSVEGQEKVEMPAASVVLQPANPTPLGSASSAARPDAQGNFVFTGVLPDRYLLRVTTRPGLYLKSARLGSEDVLEGPLDLASGAASGLHIVLGTSAGEISGVATNAEGIGVQGAWVVLIPDSAKRREMPQFYSTATTGQSGGYKFTGVAPGGYKMFAWENIASGAWMDPDVVKAVESKGRAVQIREGSKETVDVKVIPAPE